MKICPKCGAQFPESYLLCKNDGFPLRDGAAEVEIPQPELALVGEDDTTDVSPAALVVGEIDGPTDVAGPPSAIDEAPTNLVFQDDPTDPCLDEEPTNVVEDLSTEALVEEEPFRPGGSSSFKDEDSLEPEKALPGSSAAAEVDEGPTDIIDHDEPTKVDQGVIEGVLAKMQAETEAAKTSSPEDTAPDRLPPVSKPEVILTKRELTPKPHPEAKIQAKIKALEEIVPAEAGTKVERPTTMAELVAEAKVEPDPKAKAKAKPELKAKAKPELEAKAKLELEAKAKPELEAKAKPKLEAKAKAKLKAKAKPELKPKAKPALEPAATSRGQAPPAKVLPLPSERGDARQDAQRPKTDFDATKPVPSISEDEVPLMAEKAEPEPETTTEPEPQEPEPLPERIVPFGPAGRLAASAAAPRRLDPQLTAEVEYSYTPQPLARKHIVLWGGSLLAAILITAVVVWSVTRPDEIAPDSARRVAAAAPEAGSRAVAPDAAVVPDSAVVPDTVAVPDVEAAPDAAALPPDAAAAPDQPRIRRRRTRRPRRTARRRRTGRSRRRHRLRRRPRVRPKPKPKPKPKPTPKSTPKPTPKPKKKGVLQTTVDPFAE